MATRSGRVFKQTRPTEEKAIDMEDTVKSMERMMTELIEDRRAREKEITAERRAREEENSRHIEEMRGQMEALMKLTLHVQRQQPLQGYQ